ncbi:MAG: tetratricopeptide repeat protein [Planctomycetes bacterium]|nr:tetratricopeptide repeat protein [Planctomycetota bacterium]
MRTLDLALLATALCCPGCAGPAAERADPAPADPAPADPAPAELAAADPAPERLAAIRASHAAGDHAGARARLAAELALVQAALAAGESVRLEAVHALAELAEELHCSEEYAALWQVTLDLLTAELPPEDERVLVARERVAGAHFELGNAPQALAAFEEVLAARERSPSADAAVLLRARTNVAIARRELGDLRGAASLLEEALADPAAEALGDHLVRVQALGNLATVSSELGDLERALALDEEVVAALTRALGPAAPETLRARLNATLTLTDLGDFTAARGAQAEILAAWLQRAPPGHPEVAAARSALGKSLLELGDHAGALLQFETALESRIASLPPEHPDLLDSRMNVGLARGALGDLEGARAIEEELLRVRRATLPPDHPELMTTLLNVSALRSDLGDWQGAVALMEEVLTVREQVLPADHLDVLTARQNLALARLALGDSEEALELMTHVLEARERQLPPDHPHVLLARESLAAVLHDRGDFARVLEISTGVLEARTGRLPAGHPLVLRARANLAAAYLELGDAARALAELRVASDDWERALPADHPERLAMEVNLARAHAEVGDATSAREVLARAFDGLRARARLLGTESPRAAREQARATLALCFRALLIQRATDPAGQLDAAACATLEELRLVSTASARFARRVAAQPELEADRQAMSDARQRLAELSAAVPDGDADLAAWQADLRAVAEARDAADRRLRFALSALGADAPAVEPAAVARRLEPGSAAVTFLALPKTSAPGGASQSLLLAYVIRHDGHVSGLDLGELPVLEADIEAWRVALGQPLAGRGLAAATTADTGRLEALGAGLRERLVDPVLAAVGNVSTLHVVLDGALHLLPLDALPYQGAFIGQALAIRHESHLGALLEPSEPPLQGETLVVVGGLDYGAPPHSDGRDRSTAANSMFVPLPGTLAEAAAVAALHAQAFPERVLEYRGLAGTKSALFEAASRARWLHLATHGWFAREEQLSELDELAAAAARATLATGRETFTGYAPELLCGLALSGANHGRDALGRVPGILTAEELAGFDLTTCELAVLSACETNVGLRRAGQGLQSLQGALHAAGVRRAITSLWKVDDDATRALFVRFYEGLWQRGLPTAEALWQAKQSLAAAGHPVRDWAGWILSGDDRE